jgi:hypothetical protein
MGHRIVPALFLSFSDSSLAELRLGDKRFLFMEDDSGLPYPLSGSMKLHRADGTHLELDTVAEPLGPVMGAPVLAGRLGSGRAGGRGGAT